MTEQIRLGCRDVLLAITSHPIAILYLGWFDIKQRYRRSKLGPFWLTISTGFTAVGMGIIFTTIFDQPLREFLPFLCIGLVLWNFLVAVITESTTEFSNSSIIIKNLKLPLSMHILRMFVRNKIILGHNAIVILFIFILFLKYPNFYSLLFIPGYFLFLLNILWFMICCAFVCARFPDLGQIISNILQLSFFVTPIIWTPELMISKGRGLFLELNPFYHLLSVVRSPLLGQAPDPLSWIFLICTMIMGWLVAFYVIGLFGTKIVYWT